MTQSWQDPSLGQDGWPRRPPPPRWRSPADRQLGLGGGGRSRWFWSIGGWQGSAEYDPPGGKAGELVKNPDKQVRRAVDGFRQVVERGGLGAA